MPKPNRNDISIGENAWIEFIELDDQQKIAIELDEILKPIEPFLNLLETECVAACCGIDAYALWPEDIAVAKTQSCISDLSRVIGTVREQIGGTDGASFVSHRMNNFFHRKTLLQLVDHIAKCVRDVDNKGEQ